MAEAWFNEVWFGVLFGGLFGGLGGTLLGIWGALLGTLGPQGKCRGLVFGGLYAFGLLGLASLAFGVAALAAGQPTALWLWPGFLGLLFLGLVAMALGLARRTYAAAERRRLQAESLRL
jgi:hypothetical protein